MIYWRVTWYLGDGIIQEHTYRESAEDEEWIEAWKEEARHNLHPEFKLVVEKLQLIETETVRPENPLPLKEVVGQEAT